MDDILIVSSTKNGQQFFENLLKVFSYRNITTVSSGSEARRIALDHQYDLVIINTPLGDEFGHELALMLAETSSSGIMMLVKTELADEISANVEDDGVFVMAKPISKQLFFQSLKLLEAFVKRMQRLKKENIKLHKKIEEIRLVDRAKCVLIQYLGFNESQAHRYIEKQAMDMRITKGEVAEDILKTYDK